MIEYLHGKLAELTPTLAVPECAGVGYAVNITLPTYTALSGSEGNDIKLFTTEIIREDTHELYGFLTRGERMLFELLMTVSGIGANTARLIMSAYSAADIRQIIATGNAKALGQTKGIGPKTAQRVIVDLKDKVLKIDLGETTNTTFVESIIEDHSEAQNELKQEAVSALTMLGFAAAASGKAVDKILAENPNAKVEQVIRIALKML